LSALLRKIDKMWRRDLKKIDKWSGIAQVGRMIQGRADLNEGGQTA